MEKIRIQFCQEILENGGTELMAKYKRNFEKIIRFPVPNMKYTYLPKHFLDIQRKALIDAGFDLIENDFIEY